MIILDSCVLIAFADPTDIFHPDACRVLTTTEALAITALTAAETMVHTSPQQHNLWRRTFDDLGTEVIPITGSDIEKIAETRSTSGLKMPDALVLWLAESRDAAVASFDQRLINTAQERNLRTIQ